jgi:TRAP-type mannitol/chloroaromatic compound transport system substrate-binding protein
MVNLAKWNELPKAYKSAIEVASGETWAWVVGKYDYVNPLGLKKLLSQGAILRAFPQPVLEACYKAAQDIYVELSKENPLFKKTYDSLLAFRGDSTAWNQVAELGFDSFMMRMRTRS